MNVFMVNSQKQIKVMQSGYAITIHVGSNMLMKCSKTDSEYFNHKAYSMLDKVKEMEDKCKRADSVSLTMDIKYVDLGPIGVTAWDQNEHTKFVNEHEWPGLASKLSQREQLHQVKHEHQTCHHLISLQ
jgi:hypothetical protein